MSLSVRWSRLIGPNTGTRERPEVKWLLNVSQFCLASCCEALWWITELRPRWRRNWACRNTPSPTTRPKDLSPNRLFSNIKVKFNSLLCFDGSQIFHHVLSLMLDLVPNIALTWPSICYRLWRVSLVAQMVKNPPAIPGSGKSPGKGNGYPL